MRSIPEDAFLADGARVVGDVAMGPDCGVWYNAVIRADTAAVRLGARVNVQDNAVIHVSPGYPCALGDDVSVGHGAIVHGCTVGNRVIVGMGAVVMNGAEIGDDCMIGAGSVVTQGMRIPAGSVAFGNPCRVRRPADETTRQQIVDNARRYARLAKGYAEGAAPSA